MNIIFHADLKERDWILYLLDQNITSVKTDLDFNFFSDNSIHVVSSNTTPLHTLADWLNAVRLNRNVTLFHVSDEGFAGGYEYYQYFDRVIRNYDTRLARANGILTLPLGYPNGSTGDGMGLPSSSRDNIWSFAGEVKSSRSEMINAFSSIDRGFCFDTGQASTGLDKETYLSMIKQSAFVPCPMGNVVLETWRFYEALEFGAIPVVERRPTLDYYLRLLGPHPVPTFSSWKEGAKFAHDSARQQSRLDRLQLEISTWWIRKKAMLIDELAVFCEANSSSLELKDFSTSYGKQSPLLRYFSRQIELQRHNTFLSTISRLGKRLSSTKIFH